jgi:hypothetical protein
MNQSSDRQQHEVPDQANPVNMGDGYGAKVKVSEQDSRPSKPVMIRSSQGTRVVWHCSEYDF